MKTTEVLLIEDDPMVCEVNRQFIERVPGFTIVATARNGREGLEKILKYKPQLVFMDIFMPEKDGLDTLTEIRSLHLNIDIIAVTAANDFETIQRCLRLGVSDYIMKPFTFERIEKALIHYLHQYELLEHLETVTQQDVDKILYPPRTELLMSETNEQFDNLPKGFNKSTLLKVLSFIKQSENGASADEVAANIGVARVTARRYLDYLEKQHLINVEVLYGSVGRPINQYTMPN